MTNKPTKPEYTKYYVKSGQLQRLVMATSPIHACEKALKLAHGETLDYYFCVDERGFRNLRRAKFKIKNSDVYRTSGEDE